MDKRAFENKRELKRDRVMETEWKRLINRKEGTERGREVWAVFILLIIRALISLKTKSNFKRASQERIKNMLGRQISIPNEILKN